MMDEKKARRSVTNNKFKNFLILFGLGLGTAELAFIVYGKMVLKFIKDILEATLVGILRKLR